jgi:hypothetical protein
VSLAEQKEVPAPVEQKRATPAAEPAPAPAAKEPKPAVEQPKPSPDKALPSWLDGIMPARSATTRKKLSPAAKPPAASPKVPEAPRALEPPSPPPAARSVEEIEAAPPPVAAEPEPVEPPPPPSPPPPPEPERYAFLDTDAAKGFVKSLAKRVDSARSDDPLLRELHDEVETLRRTLYSPTPKRSWMGDTLKTIRAVLEEAATHSVGEEIRAPDYIAQIDRMLGP